MYDPRRKLELRGDPEFTMPCGQNFLDLDPGCYQSATVHILKQKQEAAEQDEDEQVVQNITARVRATAEHTKCIRFCQRYILRSNFLFRTVHQS